MAGLEYTEKQLKKMEDSLGSINEKLNETEEILLSNSALASHLGFVDDTGIKQYVTEMKTLFGLYKNLKNIHGIPELDAYFVELKYTLLQVSDTITNIKKNRKAITINTPQGTLSSGKKDELAYDYYKFNSKTHDEYIRQPIDEIKGIVEQQTLTLDLSVTGLENSEAQVKKLNGQLDKFRETLLGDSNVMENSLLTPEQVDAYVEALKKAIPVQLEFTKSFDNIAYGKEHLKNLLENNKLNEQLERVSNYMIAKDIGVNGNTEEISTFDINDYAKHINRETLYRNLITQGKVQVLYNNVVKKGRFLAGAISNVVDTSELSTGMIDILSSKPANTDDAINNMKKYNKLIAATIDKAEELRVQTLATRRKLAGTDNVKTYLDKKKELGKNASRDSDYTAAEQTDEVKRYLEANDKINGLNNAKNFLKSKLISGISTDTDDIGNIDNEQLRSLLSSNNTSELEQVIRFKPEIDKDELDKMKEEALALSSDIPDDFSINTSELDKMKEEALALSSDFPDDFGARSDAYIGSYIANNEKKQQSDKKTAQVAQQTAYIEEQLDNKVTETKINNKQRQISESDNNTDNKERELLANEMYKAKFNEVKNHVGNQEAITGKKMPLQDQLEYYKSAIKQFEQGSAEYLTILKLQRDVEQSILAQEASIKEQALQDEYRQVEASIKAAEDEAKRKQEALNKQLDAIKRYVSDQNAVRLSQGQSVMTGREEADYYASQLPKFAEGTREYIEVLKLKNQAEAKAADEAQKAAEIEKKAQEDAVKAARDRVNNTLGTIKKIADGINNAVNKIVSIIRNGINLINKVFSTIGKFVGKITTGAKAIVSLFGSLSNRVRGTAGDSGRLNGSFNILAGTATELRSKILLLKGAFDTLFNNQMVKKAEELMASVYSLKTIAGSGVTKEVLDWANSMEYAFGLSAKELIGDINELTGVLYGLGMTGEDTAVGSENLLMISRYLAFMGAAGGDTDVVMTKLISGMKGMTQSIDDLGLSVRDAQMDSFLESLKAQGGEFANISTDFSSLNEEARVYVRYASLISQFTKNYDITNFAKALDTVTGRMQIMKQTAASLVTTIGTGLTKAISKLAIFIVPLLKTIEAAVTKIFAFFGIDVSMTTDINEGADAVDGLNGGLDNTKDKLDKVEKSANKAKGSLQSFDRVNNVTSSSSSKGSGSGSGSDGFDYKKLMTSMLGDLNALAKEASKSFADKMQEKMKKALKTAWNNFIEYAKKITGRNIIDLEFDWNSIKRSLKNIWKNIKTLISSWGTFFIEISIKFLDDINIGKIITKFLEFISAVTDLAVAFSEVLIPVLRNFYDEVLSPIVKLVGEKIVEAFDKATEKVKQWTKYLKDNKPELIEEWTEKIKHFFNVVTGKEYANPKDGAIGTVLEILNKVGKVIKALIPIVSELASALGVFLKEEFLPWLNEKLGELAKWLSENKDDIVKFLKEIAGFVWDSFKIFVDLVSKLVDFCVKHPTEVKVFLASLVAIKIASWATSSAAGIGQLIFQLQLLSKLGGITKALGGVGTAATATSTELATIGAAGGKAAKTSVLSKVLGTTGTLNSVETADGAILSSHMIGGSGVLGGLAKFGTFMGSGATTAGGVAAAGAASIAGIAGGVAGIGAGIKDLYGASKETNEEIKEQKNWSGGTKIGMVGAGAATGAAIGSVVPGAGTAVGAAVGAGVGGVAAIFKGSDISEWLHKAWDNTLKPFFTETIPENFGKLVDGIGNFFTKTIPNTVSNIGTGISTFFTETVPENFGKLIDGVVKFFTKDVPYALGYIAGSLKTFLTETIPNFFKGLWKGIKKFFTETIPNAAETIKEKAGTFLTETIPKFFKGLWKDIKRFFTETIPNAAETIKTKAGTFLTETIPNFFKGLWKGIKKFFTETIPTAITKVSTNIKTFLTKTIPKKIGDLLGGIGDLFGGAVKWIKKKFSSIGSSFSSGYDAAVNKTSAKSAKSVTTHAVGGSIAGGQLFIANENGGAELVGNITGASGAQVANNGMIIEAMTSGVFEGVYNALAEVNNQRVGNNIGSGNTTIKLDGFGLIDSSTLNELARMLAPYLSSNNKNIADVNFSI